MSQVLREEGLSPVFIELAKIQHLCEYGDRQFGVGWTNLTREQFGRAASGERHLCSRDITSTTGQNWGVEASPGRPFVTNEGVS